MKFKYTGQLPIKDADLTLAGIIHPHAPILNGDVFEVPDKNTTLIKRVKLSGIYEEYVEPKKIKPKKEKEEKLKEDE